MKEKVLITGGNRGLGYELVKKYHSSGCDVFTLVRTKENAELLLKEFTERCIPIIADVTSDDCIEIVKKELIKYTSRIDILINNVGIPGSEFQIEKVSTNEILNLFDVHCLGIVRTVQGTLELLQESINPRIVNITSRLGSLSKMSSGKFIDRNFLYSYRVAKGAQNMLSICLANELKKKNICVVAIHPGKLKTSSGSSDADIEPWIAASNLYDWLKNTNIKDSGKYIQPGEDELEW